MLMVLKLTNNQLHTVPIRDDLYVYLQNVACRRDRSLAVTFQLQKSNTVIANARCRHMTADSPLKLISTKPEVRNFIYIS